MFIADKKAPLILKRSLSRVLQFNYFIYETMIQVHWNDIIFINNKIFLLEIYNFFFVQTVTFLKNIFRCKFNLGCFSYKYNIEWKYIYFGLHLQHAKENALFVFLYKYHMERTVTFPIL